MISDNRDPLFHSVDVEPTEVWEFKQPTKADHIRVNRGLYYHHGIYVTNDEVIHFASEEEDNILGTGNEIILTNLNQFLRDGTVEVKVYTDEELDDLYPSEHIVDFARGCLGDAGYNLVFNNCEHFANYCTLGSFRSKQVEKVVGGSKMGLFDSIGNFFGNLFGGNSGTKSRETHSYNYEPDKVRVAEIEREKEVELAKIEQQNIHLMKEAQVELIEANTKMELALLEAKARGFEMVQKTIIGTMKEMNTLAQQRFAMSKHSNLELSSEINDYYYKLEKQMKEDHFSFTSERVPQLLGMMNQFPQGSEALKMYQKTIDQQIANELEFQRDQIARIRDQQQKLIDSTIEEKDKITDHINKLVEGQIEKITLKLEENVDSLKSNSSKALGKTDTTALLQTKQGE